MAEDRLGIAVVPIRATMDNLDADLSAARGKIEKAAGGMSRTLSTIGKAAVAGVATATVGVVGLGAAMGKLAFDAMPIEGIQKAFQGLTDDADETMKALRSGSLGMVSDAELMRNYNEATQLVSKSFADDLPDAMGYLSKVSSATGQDMGYLVDSLTRGIGRLQPLILDNLAIQVDATKAYDDYAKAIGKSADDLTKQEQQTALMNQVMVLLAENTKDMPDIAQNAATKWAQLQTVFGNLKDEIDLALLPALTSVLTVLGDKLPGIVETARTEFGLLAEIYREGGLTGLGEHLQTQFSSMWETYVWPEISLWPGKFWSWLTEPGTGAIAMAAKKLDGLSAAFSEWVTGSGAQDAMKNIGSEIGKTVGNGIKWIFSPEGGLSDAVMSDVGTNMLDAAQRNLDSFFEIGATISTYMITGFIEALTGKAVAEETAQKIKDVLKTIVKMTNPASIGIELFKGIWEPFQNAWNAAFAFLKGEPISYNLAEIAPFQIPGYASGGTVPGPIGAPQLAVVHGGETVIPPGGGVTGGGDVEVNEDNRVYINTLSLYGVQDVSSFLAELEALT